MDLYDAIEMVEDYVGYCEEHKFFAAPTPEEFEAIKICLEAAKDEGRV